MMMNFVVSSKETVKKYKLRYLGKRDVMKDYWRFRR